MKVWLFYRLLWDRGLVNQKLRADLEKVIFREIQTYLANSS